MNIIWIGGTGRCGTSQLWRVLGQHPQVATGCSEFHILSAPAGAFHLMEAAIKFSRNQLDPAIEGFRGVIARMYPVISGRTGKLSPLCDKFVEQLLAGECPIEATRALIFALFEQSYRVCGETPGKGWFCEKTPKNLLAAGVILRTFPESRFIHIKRNPRGVIESWSRMDWNPAGGDLTATAKHLGDNYYGPWERMRDEVANRPNYLEVKLEDLCRDNNKMAEICAFIGIDPFRFVEPFSAKETRRWEQHPRRDLIDRLGEPFDNLMGYGWNNALLIEQEAS